MDTERAQPGIYLAARNGDLAAVGVLQRVIDDVKA
jgi:hypothetical protein